MRTAYAYSRISTIAQSKSGKTGMARQAEAAIEYCKTHKLKLDESLKLEDHGLSAFKGDNVIKGKLGLFLKLADEGKVVRKGSVLLLESLDRASRQNVLDAQELFLGIINRGITLVTLMDGQVYNRSEIEKNPAKLFISLAVMIRANEESETKSKRIKVARSKRRDLARGGKPFKIWTPPWCNWDEEKGYVPDKDKVKLLKRIFTMYLNGFGPMAIATKLNDEGIPSLSRGSAHSYKSDIAEWYKKVVALLLTDKRLVGYAHHLDKDDYFPQVIPSELFNRVQFRVSERKRKPIGGQIGKGPVSIFAGIMKCGHCGSAMAKSRCENSEGYIYHYYVCEGARTGKSSCEFKSVLLDTIEDSFLHLMTFRPWFEENLSENNEVENLEETIEALKGELLETEKQISKFTKLILGDDDPPKSMVATLKELEKKADNLKGHIVVTEGKRAEVKPIVNDVFFHNLPERMKSPEYRLKVRELLRTMIDKIVFFPRAEFPHYHVYRTNGNVWSVVFSNVSRKHRNYQLHKGKVSTLGVWKGESSCKYEGDGKGVFGHLCY